VPSDPCLTSATLLRPTETWSGVSLHANSLVDMHACKCIFVCALVGLPTCAKLPGSWVPWQSNPKSRLRLGGTGGCFRSNSSSRAGNNCSAQQLGMYDVKRDQVWLSERCSEPNLLPCDLPATISAQRQPAKFMVPGNMQAHGRNQDETGMILRKPAEIAPHPRQYLLCTHLSPELRWLVRACRQVRLSCSKTMPLQLSLGRVRSWKLRRARRLTSRPKPEFSTGPKELGLLLS